GRVDGRVLAVAQGEVRILGHADSEIHLQPRAISRRSKAIQEGYLSSEPYTIEHEGHIKPQIFLLADNGYPGYANMVLVPQKWIDKNPAAVRAFVDATSKGWRDYLYGDPRPANVMIKKDNPEMGDGLINDAISKMKSYGIVSSGDAASSGIGAMSNA